MCSAKTKKKKATVPDHLLILFSAKKNNLIKQYFVSNQKKLEMLQLLMQRGRSGGGCHEVGAFDLTSGLS